MNVKIAMLVAASEYERLTLDASRSSPMKASSAAFTHLESQLPGDRDTVLARFSIADVALGAHLDWLPLSDIELDDRRWPKTARYRAALAARPSFRATAA
jgi:glutathione S-transferase